MSAGDSLRATMWAAGLDYAGPIVADGVAYRFGTRLRHFRGRFRTEGRKL